MSDHQKSGPNNIKEVPKNQKNTYVGLCCATLSLLILYLAFLYEAIDHQNLIMYGYENFKKYQYTNASVIDDYHNADDMISDNIYDFYGDRETQELDQANEITKIQPNKPSEINSSKLIPITTTTTTLPVIEPQLQDFIAVEDPLIQKIIPTNQFSHVNLLENSELNPRFSSSKEITGLDESPYVEESLLPLAD